MQVHREAHSASQWHTWSVGVPRGPAVEPQARILTELLQASVFSLLPIELTQTKEEIPTVATAKALANCVRDASPHAEIAFVGSSPHLLDSRLEANLSGASANLTDTRAQIVSALDPSLLASWVKQVHGDLVLTVEPEQADQRCWTQDHPPTADGLTTSERGIALTLVTADCLPVLLADADQIAAVHAGWRGFAAGILERGLERFARPCAVTAWIGPAIGACCYEVGDDVACAVAHRAGAFCVRPKEPRPHLDLPGAAHQLLLDAGVRDVRASVICTHCDPRWASYRRDGGGAGRNVAVIWRRDGPRAS